MVRVQGEQSGAISTADVADGRNFADFFREHHRRLFRALYLLTSDTGEADDLAQEAMVRVFERWERVGRVESPVGYLYRTALNLQRSRRRRAARWARRSFRVPPPEDPFVAVESRADVHRGLDSLTQEQREAIVLVDWLGYTSVEAAAVLDIQAESVRSRVHRGRQRLREELGFDE